MAKKPETVFQDRIKPLLDRLPNSWFEKISQRSIRGTPDILGCVNGLMIGLELKRDGETEADLLQIYKLERINRAGGMGLVVSPENWSEVYLALTALSRGEKYDRTEIGTA